MTANQEWPKRIAATLNTKFGSKMGLEDQHALGGASYFVPAQVGTLTAKGPGTMGAPEIDANQILSPELGVRRLTPTECERLQGFPDGWTIPDGTDWREHPKPDGPRYAQMGNAVTVPVAEWIGRRIMEYGR